MLVKSQNKELASMHRYVCQPKIKPYPFYSRLACVCDMLVNLKLAAGGKKSLFPNEFDLQLCREEMSNDRLSARVRQVHVELGGADTHILPP